MKISLVIIGLLAGLFVQVAAQSSGELLQQVKADVVYLASDYLMGRESGLPSERMAADYIAWRLAQEGVAPAGKDDTYFHDFNFQFRANPHAATGESRVGRNVVGLIDNAASTTVVIGAHYDHLGLGGFGSLHAGGPEIHNGADDNASGVAILLYLAKQLRESEAHSAHNYLFIAFSGEEMGLLGSKKWVDDPTIELDDISYMINLDMVGRLNEERVLAIHGVGTSPAWPAAIEEIDVDSIQTVTTESGVGPSDHTSFYLKDIPSLHFFTGQHGEYHKPTDDVHLINFPGLLSISDFILALITEVQSDEKLAFTPTKNDNQRQAASFKVSLGVMPDYVNEGEGMRIDSVIEGRPAAEAGLKGGDVIIKMGDLPIGDIYEYMEGLSKFEKGQTTEITVLRDGKELSFQVTF